MKSYFVYILSSKTGTIYVGVTNNLNKRIYEHKHKLVPGFTAKYNINRLMFYQEFHDINQAIAMKKQLKGWSRQKKIDLIREFNSYMKDLTETVLV